MSKQKSTSSSQPDWQNDYEPILPPEIPAAQHAAVKAAVLGMRTTPGETVGDVARVFTPFVSEERAMDLASSELTRAAAAATNAQQRHLRSQSIAMVRVWSTNNDAHVCAICQSFDKQTEDVWGTQFPKGPPAHEGCRCDISLRLDLASKAILKTMPEQLAAFVQRLLGKR
jgi:hypothetical protein